MFCFNCFICSIFALWNGSYEDRFQALLRKVKTDKIILNIEKPKIETLTQEIQTEEPLLFNNFTQTTTLHKRARAANRNHMISQTKIQRVSTIVPQTFRGGGFLYYSRSIDEDEANSVKKQSYYEDFE